MFDKILVPLDQSVLAECVLPHTVAIARAFQSQVTLLNVLERSIGPDNTFTIEPLQWRIRQAEADCYLRSVANRFQETDVPLSIRTLEGKAAEQITDFSRTSGMNLIILSSHGESGLTGWNISSVVQKVVMRARTSIMIVPAYHCKPAKLTDLHYRRLLVPMDGSRRAECVWPIVTRLACAEGAEILLTHVVKPPEMPHHLPLTPEDMELADRVVLRNQEEVRWYINELRSRSPSSLRVCVLVGGNVPATLHQLATEQKVDLVVLSAHGYSGGIRFPYGGVAISFIVYGNFPVLIMQDIPMHEIPLNRAESWIEDHIVLPMPHRGFDCGDRVQSNRTSNLATGANSIATHLSLSLPSKTADSNAFALQMN